MFEVAAALEKIAFAPNSELEEILQNVRTILTTTKYSVALDRDFGLEADAVDSPIQNVQAKLTAEIIEKVEKYEPRVQVKQVDYDGDFITGKLIPKVRVVIK